MSTPDLSSPTKRDRLHRVQVDDPDGCYSFLQTICKILQIDRNAGQIDRKILQIDRNAGQIDRKILRIDRNAGRIDRKILRIDRKILRIDRGVGPTNGIRTFTVCRELGKISDVGRSCPTPVTEHPREWSFLRCLRLALSLH